MRSISFPATILGVGIALSGFFVAYALVETRSYNRYVQVKGLSERIVKADKAIWTMNFRYADNDLNLLYQGINQAQANVKQFLTNQGFKLTDMSMNPVAVTDNQSNSYNTNEKAQRYSASAGISVATSQVEKVLNAIQKTGDLVKQGVIVTSSNANYRFTHLNEIKPQMLDEATASAQKAAMSFSDNAKAKLGSIRNARQGIFTITDANSNYNSGTSVMKKVRIVTTVEFFLK